MQFHWWSVWKTCMLMIPIAFAVSQYSRITLLFRHIPSQETDAWLSQWSAYAC